MFVNHRGLQYMAVMSGSFAAVAYGINVGWLSPYLPYLLSPESYLQITFDQGAWLAVMSLIGCPVGAISQSFLIDTLGRKASILMLGPIVLLCYLIIAFTTSIEMLMIAKLVLSATDGAYYVVLPMYLGEIADPEIRGFVGSSISVMALIGTILINVIGPFFTIQESAFITMCIPILHFTTFMWMPESPYTLIKKGYYDQAERSLKLLRGREDVRDELVEITEAVERQTSNKKSKITDLFTVASNRRACLIYIILALTNKLSGKNPIIFYTTLIFIEAGGSIDPVISVVIFSVVSLLASIFALCVIDRFGRRPIMLFSALGCGVSLLAEAFYFSSQKYFPEILHYIRWLPLTSLVSYNIIFSIGLNYGPTLFLAELFPMQVKARALGLAEAFTSSVGSLATKFFQTMTENFGMLVPFWTFGCFSLIGGLMIYLFVIETKGKTLEEIQQELMGEKPDETSQIS